MKRRTFIRNSALAAASTFAPWPLNALDREELVKLTILHTNDVHSRIDPFPDDHRQFPGMGGAAVRSALIEQVRRKEEHVLLLDAGDILQGTPYFNVFRGEVEFRLMNEMGYDAATIGNHDFDAGMDRLAELVGSARFPMLNCNYDFRDTAMEGLAEPYRILEAGPLRIGLTGVGIELDGLVPGRLYGGTRYADPVDSANRIAKVLREEEKCDYVIALSHLGYQYEGKKVSDRVLAERSSHIDLIIGGHTHTFLDKPVSVINSEAKNVMISQVGWAGVILGKIEIFFHKKNRKKSLSGQTVIVHKKSIEI